MSVVVLNVLERKMYADTVVSYGHIDAAQYKKVRHYQTAGYNILLGGIGTPEAIDIMCAAALSQIENMAEFGAMPGERPSITSFKTPEEFLSIRDMINNVYEKVKMPSDVLVMAQHIETDKVFVGVMNDSALIQWDVDPLCGDDCLVIGSAEIIAAWNACRLYPLEGRLKTIRNIVQYLKSPNKFTVTDIYGDTQTIIEH